ncbi:P-loop containing nucleoside triphosphate hydrolase protein [Globomyces pollinis-pini]|nr:P-loop containing nucleoside triphosphate hydrolase protein [Globomyces pollinis-pini]
MKDLSKDIKDLPVKDTPQQVAHMNWFSFATASWITPLLVKGSRKPLEDEDLPLLDPSLRGETFQKYLIPYWASSKSFISCIWSAIWFSFASATVLEFLAILIEFFGIPIVLKELLSSLSSPDLKGPSTHLDGKVIGLVFFLLQVIKPLVNSLMQATYRTMTITVQSMAASAMFKKNLILSGKARKEYSDGRILNMVNTDSAQVARLFTTSNECWSLPVKIIFASVQLGRFLGSAAWSTVVLLCLSLTFTILSGRVLQPLYKGLQEAIDDRLAKLREALLAMRVIKYRGLEKIFYDSLYNLRYVEFNVFQKISLTLCLTQGFTNSFPALVPLVAFMLYTNAGNLLVPSVVFPCLSLFGSLQEPIYAATIIIQGFVIALTSWNRVSEFLNAEEIQPNHSDPSVPYSISMDKAVFKYHELEAEAEQTDSAFKLDSISLDIEPGQLVAVVGSVGSGKSSFLSSILGSMLLKSGKSIVNGSLAYCQQQPWIQSGSLKENILFTSLLDQSRFNECLTMCSLSEDLYQFSDGINTEIGENGINLSGGQKSRVALARSIYKDSDIYLLDDPLASLDAKVSKFVFENAILKGLKSKTVLMVTHQLYLLQRVDKVLVLKDGKLEAFGTFTELMETNESFQEMMADIKLDDGEETMADGTDSESVTATNASQTLSRGDKIIAEEERMRGKTSWTLLFDYIKLMGPAYIFINIFSAICTLGFTISQNLYLANVTEQPTLPSDFFQFYLGLGIGQSLSAIGMYNLFYMSNYVAQKIHTMAITGIFSAPISFFDTQPVGRIVNRFDSDMEVMQWMCNAGLYLTKNGLNLIIAAVLVAQVNAGLLIILCVLSVSFWYLFQFFQKSNIEMQRIKSVRKSPVDSHISIAISGAQTIGCFGLQDRFLNSYVDKLDCLLTSGYLMSTINIWVNLRMNLLTTLITAAVLLLTFNFPQHLGGVGSIGLALVSATGFSSYMYTFLLYLGVGETELNSFERLMHYGNNLPKEPEFELPSDPSESVWPSRGLIEFKDVELAYVTKIDKPVVKDLNVVINAGEKVGVCGRTGSGKSTLATSLFRMVETTKGTITIDDKDIKSLGIKTLRSRIEMIPQEPKLFDGSWRFNLDIEDKYTDHELWEALELVGLKKLLWDTSEKLSTLIVDGGDNLSFGQRQLLCLARSILSKPKILIMDEATSSIDSESDELIQKVLLTQFKNTTVLSIAHRLNTIASFDRVMVLDNGDLKEFDTPFNLLTNGGIFAELVAASGTSNIDIIRTKIEEKHQS